MSRGKVGASAPALTGEQEEELRQRYGLTGPLADPMVDGGRCYSADQVHRALLRADATREEVEIGRRMADDLQQALLARPVSDNADPLAALMEVSAELSAASERIQNIRDDLYMAWKVPAPVAQPLSETQRLAALLHAFAIHCEGAHKGHFDDARDLIAAGVHLDAALSVPDNAALRDRDTTVASLLRMAEGTGEEATAAEQVLWADVERYIGRLIANGLTDPNLTLIAGNIRGFWGWWLDENRKEIAAFAGEATIGERIDAAIERGEV